MKEYNVLGSKKKLPNPPCSYEDLLKYYQWTKGLSCFWHYNKLKTSQDS